jgi:hypothetical protein
MANKQRLPIAYDMTGITIERGFRKLAPATQAALRRVAVAMVRAGRTRIEAAEAAPGDAASGKGP